LLIREEPRSGGEECLQRWLRRLPTGHRSRQRDGTVSIATSKSSNCQLQLITRSLHWLNLAARNVTSSQHIGHQQEKRMTEETSPNLVELATDLTIAWLGNPNNRASADEVPEFLKKMHATVSELSGEASTTTDVSPDDAQDHVPAVWARKSLASKDHTISMIDGKPYKTLRRHLSTHGLTPEEYRQRYNLKPDYPMVAPSYSEQRRSMAKKIGLGNKGRAAKGGQKPKSA
jgi:predicted transcriptional regulator